MLLGPIHDLSAIPHVDIRQKQLECLLQVLHSNGDMLTHGWPSVLAIIGAVSNDQGYSFISNQATILVFFSIVFHISIQNYIFLLF